MMLPALRSCRPPFVGAQTVASCSVGRSVKTASLHVENFEHVSRGQSFRITIQIYPWLLWFSHCASIMDIRWIRFGVACCAR